MYVMEQIKAWRVLLGKIIADPQEQQRIANALGINPATLDRWANDESNNPRLQNLRRLVKALPGQREEVLPLILLEFPELEVDAFEETDRDYTSFVIPSEFYNRLIEPCPKTPKYHR